MIAVLVTCAFLGQNTECPGVKGEVYFGSQFVDVLVHTRLVPRQGSITEEKALVRGRQEAAAASPPLYSLPGYEPTDPCHPQHLEASAFSQASSHTRHCARLRVTQLLSK